MQELKYFKNKIARAKTEEERDAIHQERAQFKASDAYKDAKRLGRKPHKKRVRNTATAHTSTTGVYTTCGVKETQSVAISKTVRDVVEMFEMCEDVHAEHVSKLTRELANANATIRKRDIYILCLEAKILVQDTPVQNP